MPHSLNVVPARSRPMVSLSSFAGHAVRREDTCELSRYSPQGTVMTSLLRTLLTIFLIAGSLFAQAAEKPNVLFIAADDLRNDLGCLGNQEVLTPHLDGLAKRGRLFTHAYCQQAVCNPSRASLMTSRRPDTLKIWDLPTHLRERMPDVVTLPQHFMDTPAHSIPCRRDIFFLRPI